MHLYKHFFRLIGKNKSGIILYSIIFVAMILCLTVAPKDNGAPSAEVELSAYEIGYIDADNSVLSRGILEYLAENNVLTDMSGRSEDSVKTLIYFETVHYVLEFEAGYEEKTDRGERPSVKYTAGLSTSAHTFLINDAIEKYVKNYTAFLQLGKTPEEAVAATRDSLKKTALVKRYIEEGKEKKESRKEIVIYNLCNFFSYVSFGAIVLCLGGVLLTNSKEKIVKRIQTSPVSESRKVLSEFLGTFSAGMVLLVFFSVFICIFGAETQMIRQHFLPIFLLEFAIIVFDCSFAVFVSGFDLKEGTLSIISNVVGLSMSFISGVFVPQYLIGKSVLRVGKLTPFYRLCVITDSLFEPQNSIISYSTENLLVSFGIILLFAISLLLAGMLVRKQRKNA